jgi:hypothetical protein
MLNLGRVFWAVVGLSLWSWGIGVSASVDHHEVVKGNSVTLSLKAVGGDPTFPIIDKIGDAMLEGSSTSRNQIYSLVNGTMKNESSTTLHLRFRPDKNMTIPSYAVKIEGKTYKTKPIAITLVTSNAPKVQGNQRFSLRLESTASEVAVGESFMVTGYFALHRNVQVAQEIEFDPPNLSDFSVVQMEQKPAYMQGEYQVQEISYMVTPQQEGNFTIAPATVKVAIADESRGNFWGMLRAKWYQAQSNALDIRVLQQPHVSDVVGSFEVSSSVDSQQVDANKPVNLTVTIKGEGSLQGFELDAYQIEGVTIYTNDPKVDTQVLNGKLYSIYTQSFAIIGSRDFTIPSKSFTAYNPKKKALETLLLNSFNIKVNADATLSTPNQTPTGVVQAHTPITTPTKEVIVEKIVKVEKITWWMLLLSFIAGVVALPLVRRLPRLKRRSYTHDEALKVLYAHIDKDPKVEAMVRQLYAKKQGEKGIKIDKRVLREMVERINF